MTEVRCTPLYGARTALVEIGSVHILLNCGWDVAFDVASLEPLREVASKINLVLLTHHSLEHLGGLPLAFGRLGIDAPIYCTVPVHKMGQMTLYDAHSAMVNEHGERFSEETFGLDDVDAAFDRIKTLKFSQHLVIKGTGIEVTPYAAGHTIGGAFWRIVYDGTDEVIFAVDLNHKRCGVAPGCGAARRSCVMVSPHPAQREAS